MLSTIDRAALPLLCLLAGSTGCKTAEVPPASYPPKITMAAASSARCSGATCRCRSLTGDAPQEEADIAPGKKRFELRLPRSTSAIWVDITGVGTFYKAPKSVPPACYYVDLAPGQYRLTIHSENRDPQVGLQTGLTVYEYGPKEGPHWYRSLHFVCGGLNKCSPEDLKQWVGFQRRLPRGVLDPCGSVMIRGATFGGTRLPDSDVYDQLTVRMVVKVYSFETYRPPGSPKCKAPIKNR